MYIGKQFDAICLLAENLFFLQLLCLLFVLWIEMSRKLSHCGIYRGYYMSVNVLLILLNELGKRDKMLGLPSILSLFRNGF